MHNLLRQALSPLDTGVAYFNPCLRPTPTFDRHESSRTIGSIVVRHDALHRGCAPDQNVDIFRKRRKQLAPLPP